MSERQRVNIEIVSERQRVNIEIKHTAASVLWRLRYGGGGVSERQRVNIEINTAPRPYSGACATEVAA